MEQTETILQIQAELVKVESRAHRALRITLDSQEEVSDEARAKIMSLHEKVGWLTFLAAERKIDALDVIGLPDIVLEKDEKSPSTRYRNALFVYYEQNKKEKKLPDTFDAFYRQTMEKQIEAVKQKLT